MMARLLVALSLLFYQLPTLAFEPTQITISATNTGPSPPYRWFNYCSGEWNGSAIQTVRRAFNELNIQVAFEIPIKPSDTFATNLPQQLQDGRSDAILSMPQAPYPGIAYIPTPIIEINLTVFYPATLGKINSLEQLQHLPGFFFNRHKPDKSQKHSELKATRHLIQKWAKAHNLSVTGLADAKKYADATKGAGDHYIIDSKYSTIIDRNKYQLLPVDIKLANYYFALADRPPWKKLRSHIESKMKYIRESGLLALLEQANLKRWVSERETILNCKNNFQPQ